MKLKDAILDAAAATERAARHLGLNPTAAPRVCAPTAGQRNDGLSLLETSWFSGVMGELRVATCRSTGNGPQALSVVARIGRWLWVVELLGTGGELVECGFEAHGPSDELDIAFTAARVAASKLGEVLQRPEPLRFTPPARALWLGPRKGVVRKVAAVHDALLQSVAEVATLTSWTPPPEHWPHLLHGLHTRQRLHPAWGSTFEPSAAEDFFDGFYEVTTPQRERARLLTG